MEAMTYRVGHHSTSDDSSKYRPIEEVQEWNVVGQYRFLSLVLQRVQGKRLTGLDNPIHRFRAYLASKGWWSESDEAALMKKTKADVMKAFTRAEKLPKPKLSEMFNDVWAVAPGEQVPTVIVSTDL